MKRYKTYLKNREKIFEFILFSISYSFFWAILDMPLDDFADFFGKIIFTTILTPILIFPFGFALCIILYPIDCLLRAYLKKQGRKELFKHLKNS